MRGFNIRVKSCCPLASYFFLSLYINSILCVVCDKTIMVDKENNICALTNLFETIWLWQCEPLQFNATV